MDNNNKYLLCEILDNDNLVVLDKNLSEEDVKSKCSWSNKYANRNLILIPFKNVFVEEINFGNDISVEIQ